jgi:hypothetical protein
LCRKIWEFWMVEVAEWAKNKDRDSMFFVRSYVEMHTAWNLGWHARLNFKMAQLQCFAQMQASTLDNTAIIPHQRNNIVIVIVNMAPFRGRCTLSTLNLTDSRTKMRFWNFKFDRDPWMQRMPPTNVSCLNKTYSNHNYIRQRLKEAKLSRKFECLNDQRDYTLMMVFFWMNAPASTQASLSSSSLEHDDVIICISCLC